MHDVLHRYAALLVHYCLRIQPGDRVFIATSVLAEPLVREVYREALEAGAALVECDLAFRERERLLLQYGSPTALQAEPPLTKMAMESFDCYLHIRAPHNLKELQNAPAEALNLRQQALQPIHKTYFERIADGRLRRNLCQYPTDAAAQEAGMSLSEYEHFVYRACKLFEENPIEAWVTVRQQQQRIVDFLHRCIHIRYVGPRTDISFSTAGRTWINSDGRNNMPSGEVFTSPVEDSVEGTIHFSYPALYRGREVEDFTLWVEGGYIQKWEARRGQDVLDDIFSLPGARRFGEAAIGTNYSIRQMTRNILFDEKIGGTVHMAIGQSYLQCGGKNESPLHLDFITDMTEGGEIWADGECIYRNGHFLF